jgi:hypothetical protein
MDTIDPNFCGRWVGRDTECGPCDACEKGNRFDLLPTGPNGTEAISTLGCSFRQLPMDVPALAPFYSDWELRFNTIPYVCKAQGTMGFAFGLCAVYLLLVFAGQRWMRGRKPLRLKRTLAAWNLGLSIFSFVGFLRTAPHLLYYLFKRGPYLSVRRGTGPGGRWRGGGEGEGKRGR